MKKLFTLTVAFSTLWTWSFGQNVGVDVATPEQKLDVAGGIKIGNTSNGVAGSLRWNGTDLQIHDGTGWLSLGANTDDQTFDVIQLSGTDLQLSLENDGVGTISVDLSSLADNTDDQTIDLAQLVGTSLEISLEDDGQAPQSIDLSSLANTDDQTIDLMTIAADQLTLSLEDDGQAPLTVDLSGYLDNTDSQQFDVVQLSGNNLELSLQADGQATHVIDLSAFAVDTDDQTIDVAQLVGTDLQLSLEDDGQATLNVDMSGLANTDDQTIDTYNITGDQLTISLEDDGQAPLTVDLTPYKDNTDDQQLDLLQLNGTTLEVSLEDDGQAPQTVDLSVFDDNTDDQTFDIIQLVGDNLELSLEDDGQATHSIDLSGYADNTDDQTIDVFSLTGTDLNLSLEDDGTATQIVDLSPLKTSLEDADTDTKVEVEANLDEDRIRFTTATAERMIIREDGKVGIGTTAPDNLLTVGGSPSTAYPALGLNSGNQQSDFNDGAQIAFGYNNTDEYQHFIHTRHNQLSAPNNAIDFYVHSGGNQNNTVTSGSTHVMSLNAGNVGIGTTSPANKLHVAGNGRFTSLAGGGNRLVMANNSGDFYATTDVPGGDGSYIWNGTASQSANFHITGTGDVGNDLYVRDNLHVTDEAYIGDWVRFGTNDGLLWTSSGWDMFPLNSSDMFLQSGNTSSGSLRLRNGTTTRGYIHWTSSEQGWLNNARQWQIKTRNGDGLSPNLYFDEEGNENWTGNPGNDEGKIEYHSNRFYMASGANSAEIVRFRQSGTDRVMIDNSGNVYNYNGWFRTFGSQGLYFESHGGGWHMTDGTWIRAYNNKSILTNNHVYARQRVRARTIDVGEFNDGLPGFVDGQFYRTGGNAEMRVDDWLHFRDNDGAIRITHNTNDGSVRAHIFYDQNNTGYYINPNGGNSIFTYGNAWLAHNSGKAHVGHGNGNGYYCCGTDWWGCDCTAYNRDLSVYGGAEAVAWYGWSDGRYKKNVSTVSGALDLVKSMRGVYYDWDYDQDLPYDEMIKSKKGASYDASNNVTDGTARGHRIGVIAQEMAEVLPQVVAQFEDTDSTGAVIGEHMSVNYDDIIPVLIEAIKEQQVQIEELQAMVGVTNTETQGQEVLDAIRDLNTLKSSVTGSEKDHVIQFITELKGVSKLNATQRQNIELLRSRYDL